MWNFRFFKYLFQFCHFTKWWKSPSVDSQVIPASKMSRTVPEVNCILSAATVVRFTWQEVTEIVWSTIGVPKSALSLDVIEPDKDARVLSVWVVDHIRGDLISGKDPVVIKKVVFVFRVDWGQPRGSITTGIRKFTANLTSSIPGGFSWNISVTSRFKGCPCSRPHPGEFKRPHV